MKQNKTKPIQRIGITANSRKSSCKNVVRTALSLIRECGRTVVTDQQTASWLREDLPFLADAHSLAHQVDLLLVFGGDGTMLRVAHDTLGVRVPLLGINLGGMGFLTDVPSSDLAPALKQLWNDDYRIEPRALIEAGCHCRDHIVRCSALNDIVISRGIVSRLIELEVKVDGEILTRYRGDGLIVSTPTGSTAYSLAAGGAVVSPTAGVFTITPICPHTLSSRSVIVGIRSRIEVKVLNERPETILSADGQGESELTAGDIVTLRRSRHNVRLVRLGGTSFFETLRQKLQWTGSHIVRR